MGDNARQEAQAEPAAESRPDGSDDAALITLSLRAPECFGALFDRHAPVIHRYIARRLGPDAADDLVAETFLVIPIETASGKRHASITVGRGPGSIAITPDGKTAYVPVYGDGGAIGLVVPIRLATGKLLAPIRVGQLPTAIAIRP